MLKSCVSILALVSIALCSLCSCADEEAVRPAAGRSARPGDDEWIEDELRKAPELIELLAIRDELAAMALARGVTADEIRETAGDADRSNALLGLAPDEASARFGRINALIGSLFTRYPALADAAAREEALCAACDAEGIARAWEHYSKALPAALETAGWLGLGAPAGRLAAGAPAGIPASGIAAKPLAQGAALRPPLTCKMTQLIIGFGLCAVKSGGSLIFYTLCAYGVFCSACDGGASDAICP